MDETRIMKVGAVAEAAGLTVRTLHHWDSIGLLSPSERSPAGHRGYTEATWYGCTRCWPCAAWAWIRSPSASTSGSTRPVWSVTTWPRSGRPSPSSRACGPLAVLRDRAEALGPLVHYLLEVEWPELYRRAERLRAAGTSPGDPRVQRLVARIDELGARSSGGDRKLSAGVRAAWADDPAGLAGVPAEQAITWGELARYLDIARQRNDTKEQEPA